MNLMQWLKGDTSIPEQDAGAQAMIKRCQVLRKQILNSTNLEELEAACEAARLEMLKTDYTAFSHAGLGIAASIMVAKFAGESSVSMIQMGEMTKSKRGRPKGSRNKPKRGKT